ncbi:hypothetical protein TWF730_005992 [Orbilia blumenaviensis]|uniref:Uncharacterized protein n=1 Tax=Orbilia blumenaviensis TaxID=1796055 RepID=A0AAV9VMS9_9PEZI
MMAEYYFGHTHMPLWQFVGLLIMFSILLGSPIFICFAYHRRKERARLDDVDRRASAQKSWPEYVTSGRDYYILPFPAKDMRRPPNRVSTPRREVSGNSTVPLLFLEPGGNRSRNISPMQGRAIDTTDDAVGAAGPSNYHERRLAVSLHDQREAVLNANFAERTGTVTSVAYPQTAHRVPRTGGYGTLGHVMHSTYNAAQRAYRGRHRLNFWSGWVPWGKSQARLEAIDEESVGSSRFSKGTNSNPDADKGKLGGRHDGSADSSSSNVDIVTRVTIGGTSYKGNAAGAGSSVGTFDSETSGFSINTPPMFEKVDPREPYNPSMARSLTRRLLKFGFDQTRDGVTTPEREEADEDDGKGAKQASGFWKRGIELKKRALERQKLETGNRLFSFQKKRAEDDEDDENGREGLQGNVQADPDDLAKTSIRDFAHAFNKDIVGEDDEEEEEDVVSATGTIRIHRIDDEDDRQSIILSEDRDTINTMNSSCSSPGTSTFEDIDLDSSPTPITNENIPTSAVLSTQVEIPTLTTGTLRGRKTLRDRNSVPRTQKTRMTRNTPKNTLGRTTLQIANVADKGGAAVALEASRAVRVEIEHDRIEILQFEDIRKAE